MEMTMREHITKELPKYELIAELFERKCNSMADKFYDEDVAELYGSKAEFCSSLKMMYFKELEYLKHIVDAAIRLYDEDVAKNYGSLAEFAETLCKMHTA